MTDLRGYPCQENLYQLVEKNKYKAIDYNSKFLSINFFDFILIMSSGIYIN